VRAHDQVLHRDLIFHPDLLVLGVGISPQADNETLAKLLKVPLTQDHFFLEAHVKLRPVEFATDGVFLAGMAHSPRSIEESIVQAQAAAGRAAVILAKEGIEAGGKVATVIERNCAGCGVCESVCAYSAVQVVEKKVLGQMKRVAEVNATLCKGCGACSGGCRSNAIDLEGFTNEEIVDAVEAMLQPI
jgi:heterodisulfide reductase subunit A